MAAEALQWPHGNAKGAAMNIKEFRTQYPQYNDMGDQDLAEAIHAKYYPDRPYFEVSNALGLKYEDQAGKQAVEDPWIDPIDAVSGGAAGGLRTGLGVAGKAGKALLGAGTSLLTEPIAGGAAETAEKAVDAKAPDWLKKGVGITTGILTGLTTGKLIENPLERVITQSADDVAEAARKAFKGNVLPPEQAASAVDEGSELLALPPGQGFKIVPPEERLDRIRGLEMMSQEAERVGQPALPPGQGFQVVPETERIDRVKGLEMMRQNAEQAERLALPSGQGFELAPDYRDFDAPRPLTSKDEAEDVFKAFRAAQEGEAQKMRGTRLHDVTSAIPAAGQKIKAKVDEILSRPTVEGDTVKDYLVRKIQDKFRPVANMQAEVAGRYGGELPEQLNVYRGEELFTGKTGYDLEAFEKGYVEPLAKGMAQSKISSDELGEYLYALHAPERNAVMARRNPDKFGKGGGSGMTDDEAAAIVARYEQSPKGQSMKEAATQVGELRRMELDIRKSYGLIDQETYDSLLRTYPNYVPLKGLEGKASRPGTGKGFDTRRSGIQTAFGRQSKAENPLVHMLTNVEQAIVQGRKNEVSKRLLNLVRENPDLGTINKVDSKPRLNADGEVEYVNVPPSVNKEAIGAIEDGKHYYIEMKDPLVARAMKNMNAEQSSAIIQGLAKVNRFLSAINTSYNPEFLLSNFTRDLQTAAVNLAGEQSAKLAAKVVKDVPAAMRGAWRGFRWKGGNGAWDKLFREYRAQGGSIGFYRMEDFNAKAKTVENLLKRYHGERGFREGTRRFFELIQDANGAVENAVRLSAYKNAREAGLSKEQAASIAKNLTVNFNRRGEWGTAMNALYLFYNAGIQGTARLAQALKSPRVRAIGAGVVGSSYALAEYNRQIAGEDEAGYNNWDKIEPWVKERNLILMKPDGSGKYIKIPLPYGYNVFHVVGTVGSDISHGTKPGDGAQRLLGAVLNSFNPLGGDDSLLKTASPTILDPLVELGTNQDYAGRPIVPEAPPGDLRPDSQKAFKSTSPWTKAAAQYLNEATGGNAARPGTIDVSPETIDYLIDFFTGAAGSFLKRSAEFSATTATEGLPEDPNKIPFVRKFVGQPGEYWDAKQFRENLDEVKRTRNEAEIFARGGEIERFLEQNRDVLGLSTFGTRLESQLRQLQQRKSAIEAAPNLSSEEKKRAIEELDQAAREAMTQFNRLFRESERKREDARRQRTAPRPQSQAQPMA